MESQRDVRLQQIVVKLFGERKVCKQHRHSDAAEQQDSLRPRLLGKHLPAMFKISDALCPGVDGN